MQLYREGVCSSVINLSNTSKPERGLKNEIWKDARTLASPMQSNSHNMSQSESNEKKENPLQSKRTLYNSPCQKDADFIDLSVSVVLGYIILEQYIFIIGYTLPFN